MSIEKPLPRVREFDGHDWFLTKTYRRDLPHWELKGSTYFITFRVVSNVGWPFRNPEVAELMVSFIKSDHNVKYELHAFVVMPDHLHIILKPISGNSLASIMKTLKGSSAHAINKQLHRTGTFWQSESFDHLIRDGIGLRDKWEYIKENPVKAKLVDRAEEYPWSSFYEGDGLKPVETCTD